MASVGTTVTRDIILEVGTTTEQVTVEAGAEVVQIVDSSVSQLVDRRVWESMPLETRSQNDFINLVAGAVPQTFDNTGRGAAVNGTRTGSGNWSRAQTTTSKARGESRSGAPVEQTRPFPLMPSRSTESLRATSQPNTARAAASSRIRC
jgi:hypothetical protein